MNQTKTYSYLVEVYGDGVTQRIHGVVYVQLGHQYTTFQDEASQLIVAVPTHTIKKITRVTLA